MIGDEQHNYTKVYLQENKKNEDKTTKTDLEKKYKTVNTRWIV